ncbi:MAG: glycosyltransferase family 2 protein [Planctomycetota bacterium]
MPAISVVICCANAEKTLPAAVASAGWADELVVVDSGSEDGTGEIARAAADRYLVEPWRGYMAQKKFGAEQATHDWIFVLDGDEEISPQLAEQIRALTDAQLDALDVVYVKRRNWVMGRVVRAWSPDWQSRLIHRRRVRWPEEALHESRLPRDPSRSRKLSGHLEHKRVGVASWLDYFSGRRMDERLLPVAEQMYARGRRATWLSLWVRPWFAFWKFYLIKGAFRDGVFGLLIAQKAAVSVQLKYAALWAVQQKRAVGREEVTRGAKAGRCGPVHLPQRKS